MNKRRGKRAISPPEGGENNPTKRGRGRPRKETPGFSPLRWFKTDPLVTINPKVLAVEAETGVDLIGPLIRLFSWCALSSPDGTLVRSSTAISPFSDGENRRKAEKSGEIISRIARDKDGEIVKSMVRNRLIDVLPDGSFRIHDWEEWQEPIVDKAAKDRERKRIYYANKKQEREAKKEPVRISPFSPEKIGENRRKDPEFLHPRDRDRILEDPPPPSSEQNAPDGAGGGGGKENESLWQEIQALRLRSGFGAERYRPPGWLAWSAEKLAADGAPAILDAYRAFLASDDLKARGRSTRFFMRPAVYEQRVRVAPPQFLRTSPEKIGETQFLRTSPEKIGETEFLRTSPVKTGEKDSPRRIEETPPEKTEIPQKVNGSKYAAAAKVAELADKEKISLLEAREQLAASGALPN